ncbi:MAG: NAD(P)-binding domain-containing protein [Candidatus Latescibacteria bacterium]|jgi:thioredoxin reductase (NADPH)|nr:NAD(P)-binding domain-containing protein [Candidatus Latescibacterota bacterium]MBT4139840.1 NAD(P)-binding domain-containing protein [Candidatus Latescibacterota bacterium]
MDWSVGIGGLLVVFTVIPYVWVVKARERKNQLAFERSEKAGLNEPPSLHPVINPNACLCSGACIQACPEKKVLGFVGGKSQLIHAARCIGHGACADACPVDAIELVFGTEKRGVDIPEVSPNFETNIPNLHIVGELGGMGLIRNAVTQGRQSIEYIAQKKESKTDVLDVVIVGAGPAGLSASLEAMRVGLKFVTVDQGDIGGAIRQYPRRKLVMTQPMDIPLYGKVNSREMYKEELMDLWVKIVKDTGLEVQTFCKVNHIEKENGVFEVQTDQETFRAKHVVLAIGRRGTPRKLNVPGEDLSKVAYSLLEPEQFQDMSVMVVGGGDSALEAACSLAEEPGNKVTLSYRRDQFQRPKEEVRDRLQTLISEGKIETAFSSQIVSIAEGEVVLDHKGESVKVRNDQVFVFAGGELPTGFLKKIGVAVETKFGSA